MSDRGFHTPTIGYFALVEGVAISEDMAKRALEIVARMRAEAQAKRAQAEAKRLAELPAQKHLHLRTDDGARPEAAYLLLDPAKVRLALASIDARVATETPAKPFVLTLHKNGDIHFDHAEAHLSTDRPANMGAL